MCRAASTNAHLTLKIIRNQTPRINYFLTPKSNQDPLAEIKCNGGAAGEPGHCQSYTPAPNLKTLASPLHCTIAANGKMFAPLRNSWGCLCWNIRLCQSSKAQRRIPSIFACIEHTQRRRPRVLSRGKERERVTSAGDAHDIATAARARHANNAQHMTKQ